MIDGPVPIIVAGDALGQLIFLTMDTNPQTQAQEPLLCAQGGHNDKKQPVLKVFTITVDGEPAPVSVDPSGNFRLWKGS